MTSRTSRFNNEYSSLQPPNLKRQVAQKLNTSEYPIYKIINFAAIAGHFIAAAVMIGVYTNRAELVVPYTENYQAWIKVKNQTYKGVELMNKTSCEDLSPPGRGFETSNNGEWCVVSTSTGVGYGLDLGWLVISFHFLSFVFQGAAALTDACEQGCCGYKYSEMIAYGKNPLRFIEYSLSASIMLMCIAIVNGITNLQLIVAIAVLTASCQLCGMVVEFLPYRSSLKWVLHLTGWLQFMTAYYFIAHSFIKAVEETDGIGPPDFVWAIVIALFLLYASFGMVQMAELFCEMRCSDTLCKSFPLWCRRYRKISGMEGEITPEYKEMIFVSLSLGAKLVLGMLIFINVLFM
jgi:hypothetical protein